MSGGCAVHRIVDWTRKAGRVRGATIAFAPLGQYIGPGVMRGGETNVVVQFFYEKRTKISYLSPGLLHAYQTKSVCHYIRESLIVYAGILR